MSTELLQLVPLSRHSPFPELQAFVKLFRPKRVVPNTLDPRLKGLDWACIDQMFSSCLHRPAHLSLSPDSLRLRLAITPNDQLAVDDQHDGDVALKNLVGDGAINTAARWADQGKLLRKLSVLRDHLGDEANAIIDQLLGIAAPLRRVSGHPSSDNAQLVIPSKGKGKEVSLSRDHGGDSEEDTDDYDSGDERGRTAHKLFAEMAGIDSDDKENTWWVSSQPSDEGQEVELPLDNILSRSPHKGRGEPVGDGTWRLNRLTPVSSPVRQPQLRISKPCPPTPSPVRPHKTTQRPISSLQEPLSFPTRSPAKVSKLSAGHSLASPICLLSSSSPAQIAVEEKRLARVSASNPIRGQTSQDKPFTSSKPRALVFSLHPGTPSSKGPKYPTNSMRSRNPPAISLARQSGKLSSSAVQNARSWGTTPTPSRKRPEREALSTSPLLRLSKRPRLESKTTKVTERTTHTSPRNIPTSIALSSTSAVASITPNLPTDLQEQHQSSPSIPWVYSEQDMMQVKRIDMSQQLATTYPHLVAPTYAQKLEEQIEMLKKKKQEDLFAAVGSSQSDIAPHAAGQVAHPPQVLTSLVHSPARLKGAQKLGITRTILSFETVEDDDGGMDWNRSRQLIDALREDLKSGRKPKLPPLVCAQSPSQSLDTY
jgi:DNA cross-link repair 1C protein